MIPAHQTLSATAACLRAENECWTVPPHYLYAVVGAGKVKIGLARDPVVRLRELQVGSPVPLRLAEVWPVGSRRRTRAIERSAHALFRWCRLRGEWFDITPAEVEPVLDLLLQRGRPTAAALADAMRRLRSARTLDECREANAAAEVAGISRKRAWRQ